MLKFHCEGTTTIFDDPEELLMVAQLGIMGGFPKNVGEVEFSNFIVELHYMMIVHNLAEWLKEEREAGNDYVSKYGVN